MDLTETPPSLVSSHAPLGMSDRTVVLTGGAQGIGFETAKLLVSRGALVAIADVDGEALRQVQNHFDNHGQGDRVRCWTLDISSNREVEAWIKDSVSWGGKLDGAANVAGINGPEDGVTLANMSDEHFDLVMKVNLKGTFNCLRAQINNMNDGGSIVCVSSVKGVAGWATSSAYSAAKHGIIGMVRSAAKEEGARNIRVNAVAPGAIDTRMVNPANVADIQTPIQRIGSAAEVAHLIAFLLSDEAGFITGSTYTIDGGMTC